VVAVKNHFSRVGIDVDVEERKVACTYKTVYRMEHEPKVSIIIPTMDHVDLLRACIDSVLGKTTYGNYEIVCVENNSKEQRTFDYYDEIQQHGDKDGGKRSGEDNSKDSGKGARRHLAGARLQLFGYLQFRRAAQRRRAAALPQQRHRSDQRRLADLDGGLLHAQGSGRGGREALQLRRPHPARRHLGGARRLRLHQLELLRERRRVHEPLVQPLRHGRRDRCLPDGRRSLFDEVGGLDEQLAVALNDVDLCLKTQEKGYLTVFDPDAELYHHESSSRGSENRDVRTYKRFDQERYRFLDRWSGVPRGKFVNINLDQYNGHFKIA
jgi:GT2 family glycosyltransferase